MKNYRIRTRAETVSVHGGYVTSAGAAVLVGCTPQRIGQVADSLGRDASLGTVFVLVSKLAERWPEAAAGWQWHDLDSGARAESPL